MTPERWNQIEGVFLKAIEVPPDERISLLDQECSGDDALRREVNLLLECDNPSTPLIDRQLPPVSDLPVDMAGRRVGVYRLVRMLGHGGMGSVYLAVRDDDQFHMEVAIKLLKRGMDTDYMLARFRQERQILANLEHPFIARLLDGGATDEGLPFFVLEYVDGLPITKYCTEKRLNFTERLRLFRLVCEAVQHAHQNLVVHRDLKPGNILITKEGIPKLLDFGIAKLIDPTAGSKLATVTRLEQRMMTPAYASPEQALGLTVNTATDIYSLGAVLYEMMSGKRPHRFLTDSPDEIERVICEVEPQKPSVAADNRRLAGDLDNIILTAMRKEPHRRYTSVAEFSEDIRRHMEGLPVAAHEDQWGYRAGKFVRRHRLGVAMAVLIAGSLVGGILATTYQAQRANDRFRLIRGLAKNMIFDFHDSLERLPGSTGTRVALVQRVVGYLDGLARDTGSDPTLDLEIADAYRRAAGLEGHPFRQNLGQTANALDHYGKAIAIYERLATQPGIRDDAIPALMGALIEIGDIEVKSGKIDVAMARLQRAATIAADSSAKKTAAVPASSWAELHFRMGDAEMRRGTPDLALPYFQNALDVCLKWVDSNNNSLNAQSTLRSAYARMGGAQLATGDLDSGRDSLQTSLQIAEKLVLRPEATADTKHGRIHSRLALGDILGSPDELNLGDREGALQHYEAAKEVAEGIVEVDEFDVRSRDDLQICYRRLGGLLLSDRPQDALEYYRRAFLITQTLSEANLANVNLRRDLAASRLAIGEAEYALGRKAEALDLMTRALEMLNELTALVPDQISWVETTTRAHQGIGAALLDRREDSQALKHLLQALAATEKLLERAPANLYFQRDRADAFESLGRYYATLAARSGAKDQADLKAQARSWFQKSHAVWEEWTHRKVALPYAERRQTRILELLKKIDG